MEGDERIYVDGNATPVMQGTGVEDLFNAGWYFERGLFTLPMHGHTAHSARDGQDRVAAYRLFLQDAIPFRTHLRVSMEHGIRNSVAMDSWTLVYYYHRALAEMVLTDVLDVGSALSEYRHAYTIDHATWNGIRLSLLQGERIHLDGYSNNEKA